MILLYSTLDISEESTISTEAEFEIVECINLLTNMIDYLEQIKITLATPV